MPRRGIFMKSSSCSSKLNPAFQPLVESDSLKHLTFLGTPLSDHLEIGFDGGVSLLTWGLSCPRL